MVANTVGTSRREEEERRARAAEKDRIERVKFRQTVAMAGPKFDGTTIFQFWKAGLLDHLAASGVEEHEKLEVAKLCLTG